MHRIGVLGGTFNPIHIGHLAIAQTAKEAADLEKVIFVPSNWPPHKNINHVAPAKNRYQMVKLAIKGCPGFELSDFEIKNAGRSFTVETMRYFRKLFPAQTKLYFIIGGDMLSQLKNWKYIADILEIATFIVVNRPGEFKQVKKIPYVSVTMPGIDISSSYIRQKIKEGKTTKFFVPEAVLRYINQKKLYQGT